MQKFKPTRQQLHAPRLASLAGAHARPFVIESLRSAEECQEASRHGRQANERANRLDRDRVVLEHQNKKRELLGADLNRKTGSVWKLNDPADCGLRKIKRECQSTVSHCRECQGQGETEVEGWIDAIPEEFGCPISRLSVCLFVRQTVQKVLL